MKYKNANDIIPETLLAEVQKYAAGDLLYIPQLKERRKSWGEGSGARQYLRKRNQEIRDRFDQGQTVDSFPTHTVSLRTASERSYMQNQTSVALPQILRKKNKAFPAVAQYSWESLFPWNRKFNYT